MDTYSIERFGDWKEKQNFSPSAYIAHNCATGNFTSRIGREQKCTKSKNAPSAAKRAKLLFFVVKCAVVVANSEAH